jgi:hypothetical protein
MGPAPVGAFRYASIFENRHAPAATNKHPTASSTVTSTAITDVAAPDQHAGHAVEAVGEWVHARERRQRLG